jgi:hypothetical protein
MMILFLILTATAPGPAQCTLTLQDKTTNARLSFDDFDQKGTTPTTARQLAERGCWKEAAEATQHYLVNGPLGTEGRQRVLRFHLAQQLANAGWESEAALVMVGARNPGENLSDAASLRWNDFVRGHWAFFVKDRSALRDSTAAVSAGQGFGNELNARLLEGLGKCFDQPYLAAVSAPCRTPPADKPE